MIQTAALKKDIHFYNKNSIINFLCVTLSITICHNKKKSRFGSFLFIRIEFHNHRLNEE